MLKEQLLVLKAQPRKLFALLRGQTIAASTFITVGMQHSVPRRLVGRFELRCRSTGVRAAHTHYTIGS